MNIFKVIQGKGSSNWTKINLGKKVPRFGLIRHDWMPSGLRARSQRLCDRIASILIFFVGWVERSGTQQIPWVSGSYTQPTNGILYFGEGVELSNVVSIHSASRQNAPTD